MKSLPIDIADHANTSQKLFARCIRTDSGCLEWTGAVDDSGYGTIGVKLATGGGPRYGWSARKTHRVAWVLAGNNLTPGLVLDHLCLNRRCCEVTHLEQVTQTENVRRQEKQKRGNCHRCGSGYVEKHGRRKCEPCTADYKRSWQESRKPVLQCPECGTEFKPTITTTVCCSRECQTTRRMRGRREWMRDRADRQRTAEGRTKQVARFTDDQVRAIRADPRRHADIAADYGVGKSMIGHIKRGDAYAHVPDH